MIGFREALVDLDRVEANIRRIRAEVAPAGVLVVVKADAYGHGAAAVAGAAERAGADWVATADLDESIALRAAGIEAPLLCWLHGPDTRFSAGILAGIELGVSSLDQLERVAAEGRALGGGFGGALGPDAAPRVHLKVDTGLSRSGIPHGEREAVLRAAATLERAGEIRVSGIMSHLANTSPEEDAAQLASFEEALALARASGLTPEHVHIAATSAALNLPESRYSLCRTGIGPLGLTPDDLDTAERFGLRPVMTLRARVAGVRRIPAGAGVSYGYRFRSDRETSLALVPLGYADGIPRLASGRARVGIRGRTYPVVGSIAMDQFLVDIGDDEVAVGDIATVFGDPAEGHPSAEDWAEAAETINYEIVTRIGPRVPRVSTGEGA